MWMRKFLIPLCAAFVAFAAINPAQAQQPDPRRGVQPQKKAEPKRSARPRPDPVSQLNALFEALKQAPDAQMARQLEGRIDAALARSGSATADLLMTRAKTVIEGKDYDLSITILDSLIDLKPDFTEAYAQRATVHYLKKDLGRSLADLRVVVAREPRHYTALAGLGIILQDIGEDKRALDAFRRAVAINPRIRSIPEMMKKLEVKVEGRDI
jgi:tetratricopeptide (TPR) repeat protein